MFSACGIFVEKVISVFKWNRDAAPTHHETWAMSISLRNCQSANRFRNMMELCLTTTMSCNFPVLREGMSENCIYFG